ncbi:hypothetical protein EDD21DRAFT_431360 [Dissophora ornata]|nr:hypothetical protein EDD21DRAFT_431360 [Dissophora ornata]
MEHRLYQGKQLLFRLFASFACTPVPTLSVETSQVRRRYFPQSDEIIIGKHGRPLGGECRSNPFWFRISSEYTTNDETAIITSNLKILKTVEVFGDRMSKKRERVTERK